jgi:hypothetical protein
MGHSTGLGKELVWGLQKGLATGPFITIFMQLVTLVAQKSSKKGQQSIMFL